jgi:ABC-type branched-subunit amino acid transport system substrate-binding protein
VLITIFTNVVTAQIPLAEQLKVPLICPVEAPGVVSASAWAYAYAPTFDHDLPLLVEHWKKVGIKRLFAFFPDNAIANFYSPVAKDAAQQVGATYDEARYKLGETDYRGIVARARDFNPDSVLINGQGTPDDGVLIKQMREIGITAPLFNGSNNFSTESWRSSVGQYAEGMVFAGFVIDQDRAKPFIDAYRAKVNIDPSQVCIQAYDQTKMVAQCIDQNGYTGDGIRQGLAGLKGFQSVNGGTVDMGDDHQARPPVGLYKIQNNAIVKIQPGG